MNVTIYAASSEVNVDWVAWGPENLAFNSRDALRVKVA